MLNVLVADTAAATPVSAPSSVSTDTFLRPSSAKSQWISSATRYTPCFLQRFSTACSVCRGHTLPQGLCGEHSSISLQPGSLLSKSSRSISHLPSGSCTSGLSTLVRPARSITE